MLFTEGESQRRQPKPEKLPTVWVVCNDGDEKSCKGDVNVAKGIAEKINPNFLVHPLSSLDLSKRPDILVLPTYINLKNNNILNDRNLKDIFVVQSKISRKIIPFVGYPKIDLLAIPSNLLSGTIFNIVCDNKKCLKTLGVAHNITPEKIEAGKKEWENQFTDFPEPKIAVLLGGDCAEFSFTPEMARKMAKECTQKAKELGGSLIITTSNRTSKEATEAFMDEIKDEYDVPAYLHDWRMDAAKGNPYYGILGLADAIIVSGESMSMCCEANQAFTRNQNEEIIRTPVYIYDFDGKLRESDKALHEQLYNHKLKDGTPNPVAKPFSEFLEKGIEKWEYEPLDTAGDIAREALTRWRAKQVSSHGYV